MATKIKTTTELIYRLKTNNLNLADFDYKEGKTTDKYLESHPFIARGRRFYSNPYFWSVLFDNKLSDEIDFLYNMREFKPDYNIMAAFVVANSKIADRYFKDLANRYFDIEEHKEKMMNDLMVDCSTVNRLDYYLILEAIAVEKNIKPLFGEYANAGEGYCLYNACKCNDGLFACYLLDAGADVTLNDSMAFAVACREGNYELALELHKHGADIHTKKDLGRSMINRNDRLKRALNEKDQKAREELLKLFEEDDKREEEIPSGESPTSINEADRMDDNNISSGTNN